MVFNLNIFNNFPVDNYFSYYCNVSKTNYCSDMDTQLGKLGC